MIRAFDLSAAVVAAVLACALALSGRGTTRSRLGEFGGSPVRFLPGLITAKCGAWTARWRVVARFPGGTLVTSCGVAVFAALVVFPLAGTVIAVLAGTGAGWAISRVLGGSGSGRTTHPLGVASGWNLLAVGLRAGLPATALLREVAEDFEGTAAEGLREVACALELGTDSVSAWEPALRRSETAELARAARRSARSGSGLARVAEELAARAREEAREDAAARAGRVEVWVSAPLGLCFLPAFFCLGVLPVVLGMMQRIGPHW
ncbi:type II secretion system F family protein [Actinopolyspora saharensis]|uniref:Type II secretion system (T2SS), protein F n=1 Tax=Actinopolyspora saharensis TaxID=995062 RepID=A0A1H1F6R6_9ACTN|nr:type II secretion system F family protein [Actinopolyspora saharensis]SDQ96713.1 Type II secretion system (T2SS), protein F [Actinopolyspora saharensis]